MTTVRDAAIEVANRDTPTVDKTIAGLIERQRGGIARALPRGMDADRFARIVITECKANPQLLRCDPGSMLAAVMRAAQLGLEPGPLGHVYLVPFGDQVQFILGYKGIVALARRSGEIKDVYAEVVYEGDEFEVTLGLERNIHHKRTPATNKAKVTHAYAVARFVEGGYAFEVLDELDIAHRRSRSKQKQGPWTTDFDAMAKKSAVRALAKWLPLTIEEQHAITNDERPYDLSDLGDVVEATITEPETLELNGGEAA